MSVSFGGRYSRQFLADLKKLELPVQRRILEAIETKLLRDPFRHARKLVGKTGPGSRRFRVGEYRIRLDRQGRLLIFHRLRHRREIYE